MMPLQAAMSRAAISAASLFCEYFRAYIFASFRQPFQLFFRRFAAAVFRRWPLILRFSAFADRPCRCPFFADRFASIDAAYFADATIFMTLRHFRRHAEPLMLSSRLRRFFAE
jgi:hypothetical protein